MLPTLKKLNSYIGMGVAIRMPGGAVVKRKIVSLEMRVDADGRHVTSVQLAMPYGFPAHIDVKPDQCFRNKGECARFYDEQRRIELSRRINEAKTDFIKTQEELRQVQDELNRNSSAIEKRLQECTRKFEEHNASMESRKWNKKHQ